MSSVIRIASRLDFQRILPRPIAHLFVSFLDSSAFVVTHYYLPQLITASLHCFVVQFLWATSLQQSAYFPAFSLPLFTSLSVTSQNWKVALRGEQPRNRGTRWGWDLQRVAPWLCSNILNCLWRTSCLTFVLREMIKNLLACLFQQTRLSVERDVEKWPNFRILNDFLRRLCQWPLLLLFSLHSNLVKLIVAAR